MCPELVSFKMYRKKEQNERKVSYPHTLFVSVEQDALSLEDKDDVFWVGAVQDTGRFCAKELVGFVDFLKHVLKDTSLNAICGSKVCTPLHTYRVRNDCTTYPALRVLVWMVLLRQSEVSFPDFTLLVPEDRKADISRVLLYKLSNNKFHDYCY